MEAKPSLQEARLPSGLPMEAGIGKGKRVRRSWPRRILDYLLQLASLGIFFGTGTLLSLVVLVAKPLGATPALGQTVIHRLFRFFCRWLQVTRQFQIDFGDVEELAKKKGIIIAANHPSILDVVFLLSKLPRAVCIMRAGLIRNPAFGGGARLAGYITNDLGADFVREAARKLHEGENLLIFPEGTRTRQGRALNPFKKGFALAADIAGAEIHTVFIERSGSHLGKETPLLQAAELPIRIRLRRGEVFRPKPGEPAKVLARRLEDYFRSHLAVDASGISIRE